MERSKRQEKENQMTIYFDKRAFEQQEEDEQKEQEEKERKEAAAKAVMTIVDVLVKPAVIMLLWNWLIPGIFGLVTIGYFKALGIYALSRILFGNKKND
jgi:uncharacterized membrane protein